MLADVEKKISEADILLWNVKGAFTLQNDKIVRQE
jgi:hypothetical protein